MLDLLDKYKDIIKDYHITTYENVNTSYKLKLEIIFIDNSKLFVKEYYFNNDERKYSFHWESFSGKFLYRWDNAPHWKNIITFPHHSHTEGDVRESRITTLQDVLAFIDEKLTNS